MLVLPFHYIHPRTMRWFFTFKSILCPPAIFGMLAWACSATNGGLNTPVFDIGNTVSGSAYAWAFMNGLNVSHFYTRISCHPHHRTGYAWELWHSCSQYQ
jgi:cytosine/uracil/thiamine/allantoin permease